MLNYIIAIKIIESRERYRIFFGIKQKERKEKKKKMKMNEICDTIVCSLRN